MLTYLWAYLAGVLTLINPCVLPLLPITIAATFQRARHGPVALTLGLVSSFTLVGVGVSAFGHLVGLNINIIHRSAAVLMMVFGIILLIPARYNITAMVASPLADGANRRIDRVQNKGLAPQFAVGMLLGAVWSPCIGPTLGGAVTLAASGENLGYATVTMLIFGAGVSTVLLGLAYGSRHVITSRRQRLMGIMPWAKLVMGAMLLVVGLAIWFHIDKLIEAWLLDVMPIWLQDLSVAL